MNEISIDQSENGETVPARVGDTIQVRLPENPSTGYLWKLASEVEPALRLISSDYTSPQTSAPGARGTRVYLFKAVQPGEAVIELEHKRPWEAGAGANRFAVHIEVQS
ncbi:MAG TPA: protease inhibitor I42 family protein [Anaerolineaceae bacterium]|nr:protease inhibitor I42 family protein [Anaerolineaceae bacterium]